MIQTNSLNTLLQSQPTAKAVISTDTAAFEAISGVGPGDAYVFGRDPTRSYQCFGNDFGDRSGQLPNDSSLLILTGLLTNRISNLQMRTESSAKNPKQFNQPQQD